MTNCNKYEYPESITPTDTSDHLVVQYDSFSEITNPDPNHIYIIDGTAYVFDGMQYISIGVACETYETYEGDTEVTTQDADIILSTNGKLMNSDITIHHGHDIEDALIQNTPMDEYVNDKVVEIPDYGMYKGGIKKLVMVNLGTLRARALMNSKLTEGYFPKVTNMNNEAFRDCANLKKVDLGLLSITANLGLLTFANDTSLEVLIIRKTSVIEPTVNTFQGSTFATDGTGGYVYVPQALLSQYQADTSWQTYANVLEFRPIEGSIYE